VSCRNPIDANDLLINEVPPRQLPRMVKLLSGRMPDQSDPREVLASFTLAQDNGVRVGSVIRAQLASRAQLRAGPADPSPVLHPTLRVVGIVAAESEFPSGEALHYDLYTTTAFAAAVNRRAALLSTYYVRFAHGAADLAGSDSQFRSLGVDGTYDLDAAAGAVDSAFIRAQCPAGRGQAACPRAARHGMATVVLVRAARGAAGRAALARYIRQYPSLTYRPAKPTVLVNFGQSVNFPLLFGMALSLFGAATLVHLLLVSVARRRTETGLLKVLGFIRRQVGAAVCWQATTVALAGIVVGAPLGIAAGRVLWRVFATNFGVVPVPVVPALLLAALAAGVLAGANLLAAGPALLAARSHPGQLLRSE
jgi:hypothetical protein